MQAIAPKTGPRQTPRIEPAPQEARISLRMVSALEVASVISTVLITTWALIPLQPRPRWLTSIPTLLALALMLHSHLQRGERAADLGFDGRHFGRAFKLLLLPTAVACLLFFAIGFWAGSIHQTSHFYANLAVVPMWGLIQQYVLQGFIYRRLRAILPSEPWQPILLTAAIFAVVHAPNPSLMFLTFLGSLIWSWVYEQAPNLYALALSHGVISITLMTCLPPWLLQSMSVGYKHFLYQKF